MPTPSRGIHDGWAAERDSAEAQAFELWMSGQTWTQIGDHFNRSNSWARALVKRRLARGHPLNE